MIPINTGNIDYITMVTAALDRLVTSGNPVFLAEGNRLLTAIGIIMLVIYGLKAVASLISHHHPNFDLPGAIHFFALFLIAEAMLRYYNAPLPWGGSSVAALLPDTARTYSGTIDLTSLNLLLDRIHALVSGAEQPGFGNIFMIPVYYITLGFMTMLQAVLFAVTILGFVAIGIGTLMGPLFIPWLLVPKLSWLFWNWISFMLQYSFYRVVASALTFIWSNAIVSFFDTYIHGDFSLTNLLLMLVPFGMLCIGMAFTVFKITSFVSDLFKGTAAAGAGIAGGVASAVKGSFV